MLAGIPITFALCFDACAINQEVQWTSSTTIRQAYVQRSLTTAKGAEVWYRPSSPISCSRLCARPVVCRNGSPNSTFKVRQAWIAASLKSFCRPRLPFGGGTKTISGSNQIDSEPRRFKLSLYEDKFVVVYFVGDQLLITPGYHTGFIS